MRTVYLVVFAILLSAVSNAQDSTQLYKQRIERLKDFSRWLSTEAKYEQPVEGIYYQYDSALNKNWNTFDKAIALYFNKVKIDSIINSTTEKDVFSPDFKKAMLKGLISRFNMLSHLVLVDSLHFKPKKIREGVVLTKKDEYFLKNTICQYLIIEEKMVDYLHFTFEEGGTRLVSIISSEPQGEEGLRLSNYFHRLSIGH